MTKSSGTCWVNLGDTYSGNKNGKTDKKVADYVKESQQKVRKRVRGIPEKSLTMVPFRFAIEMVNRGWILRNTIIWHKPNCMPTSVKDRFTVDYEPMFFFSKSKKYWFESQYEPCKTAPFEARQDGIRAKKYHEGKDQSLRFPIRYNIPKGRRKRCVWRIPTKPYPEAHFAVFPEKLIETPIKAGCPEFICKKCGKAREKIFEASGGTIGKSWHDHSADKEQGMHQSLGGLDSQGEQQYRMKQKGITDCKCKAGYTSGIVLDPFVGSGTTLKVARALGRNYVGIDLNPEYITLAKKRIAEADLLRMNEKNKEDRDGQVVPPERNENLRSTLRRIGTIRSNKRFRKDLGDIVRRGIVKCCGWQESASGDFRLPLSFHRR